MLVAAAVPLRTKSPEAFRTISEVSDELDVPQHVLRFWESRFAQVRPVKRAGGRRYYRPEDVDLLRGIRALLYSDGYTIKGVQKILRDRGLRHVAEIGRGEARAPVLAEPELETEETFELPSESEAPFVSMEPTYARAAIAMLERAHTEPEVRTLPVIEEPVASVAIEEPAAPVAAEATEPVLAAEARAKLEFLLDELMALKKRLSAAKSSV